jgi:RHS repeat-associated protein
VTSGYSSVQLVFDRSDSVTASNDISGYISLVQQVRNRYYDSSLSAFVSRDPIGYSAGDENLYRYVSGNPLRAADPSGMWVWIKPSNFKECMEAVDTTYKYCRRRAGVVCGLVHWKAKCKINQKNRLFLLCVTAYESCCAADWQMGQKRCDLWFPNH